MRIGGLIWVGPEGKRFLVGLDCHTEDGESPPFEVSFRDLETQEVREVTVSRCLSMGELRQEDLEALLRRAR